MSLEQKKKRQEDAVNALKSACAKCHPKHVNELHNEVTVFTKLVQQKEGFNEKQVFCFGDVEVAENRLLANMAFIEEGIPYTVDGVEKIFDTSQHIYEFLTHGMPDQVDKWARGGVMSCYVNVFGEEKGGKMKESKWKDFLGMIPFILVKPNQEALRASLGLEIKSPSQQQQCKQKGNRKMSMKDYMSWRPVLLAKFGKVEKLKDLLLKTQGMYLLDKDDPKTVALNEQKEEEGGSNTGCIVYAKPSKKNDSKMMQEAYEKAKKEGCRVNGKLIGKNRMGRFLMAIRSELCMMGVVHGKKRKNIE